MGWFKKLFTDDANDCRVYAEPAPKKRAPRRDFGLLYPLSAKVVLLVKDNPKRRTTTARVLYDKYEFCNTVGDCIEVGMTYRIIDGDVRRGYVRIDK